MERGAHAGLVWGNIFLLDIKVNPGCQINKISILFGAYVFYAPVGWLVRFDFFLFFFTSPQGVRFLIFLITRLIMMTVKIE